MAASPTLVPNYVPLTLNALARKLAANPILFSYLEACSKTSEWYAQQALLAGYLIPSVHEAQELRQAVLDICVWHRHRNPAELTITEVPSDDARRARMSEFYQGLPPLPVDNAPAEAHQSGDEYVRALYAPFRWARNAFGRVREEVTIFGIWAGAFWDVYAEYLLAGGVATGLLVCAAWALSGVRR